MCSGDLKNICLHRPPFLKSPRETDKTELTEQTGEELILAQSRAWVSDVQGSSCVKAISNSIIFVGEADAIARVTSPQALADVSFRNSAPTVENSLTGPGRRVADKVSTSALSTRLPLVIPHYSSEGNRGFALRLIRNNCTSGLSGRFCAYQLH